MNAKKREKSKTYDYCKYIVKRCLTILENEFIFENIHEPSSNKAKKKLADNICTKNNKRNFKNGYVKHIIKLISKNGPTDRFLLINSCIKK